MNMRMVLIPTPKPVGGRKRKHASLEGCGDSKKFVHVDSMSYGCNAVCSGII